MAAQSLNDEVPKNEQLNKIQRKKVISLIEKNANDPESALIAVKDYCMALPKIKVLFVVLNQKQTPNTIEVTTSNTTHFFKIRPAKAEDK